MGPVEGTLQQQAISVSAQMAALNLGQVQMQAGHMLSLPHTHYSLAPQSRTW